MYRVLMKYDRDPEQKPIVLHDPRETDLSKHLINPKVVLKTNSVQTFEFTIREEHPWFSELKEFKSEIWVEDFDRIENIFKGRIIQVVPSVTESGEQIKECLCEDALGWLNDSYQTFNRIDVSDVREYIEKILNYHNTRFGSRQIFLRKCEPKFPVRVVTQYQSTLELLFQETVDKHGGYFQIDYDNKYDTYLDYFESGNPHNNQPIIIGTNLINLTLTEDYSNICAKFTPLGAEIPPPKDSKPKDDWETARPRIGISYKNPGIPVPVDYIYSEEAFQKYGGIEKIKIYDDITDSNKLLDKALEDFKTMNKPSRSIELKALDFAELGYEEYDKFRIQDQIRIICYSLGIDEFFVISEIELLIDSPEQSTYGFGNFASSAMEHTFKSVGDRITGLNTKLNGIHYNGQIKLDEVVNAHTELANNLTDKTNDLTEEIDTLTGNLGVYKVETDTMLASKVSDKEFQSYQIQVAGQLSSKVSDGVFESYRMQTQNAIADRVLGTEFQSYKTQTDNAISQMVKGTDFQSYVAQTNNKIALVVQDNGQINSASIAMAISRDESSLQLIADRIEIKPRSGIIEFPNGQLIDCLDNAIRMGANNNYVKVSSGGIDIYHGVSGANGEASWRFTENRLYHRGREVRIEFV